MRKNPNTGGGMDTPDVRKQTEHVALAAEQRQKDPTSPSRILIVNGSSGT